MGFVRGAWHIVVAIKDLLVLLFLLAFFGLLYAALSSRPNAAAIGDGALLLKLNGVIVEQPSEPDAFAALSGSDDGPREYGRRDLVHALRSATTDSRVKAVVLDLDAFQGGGQVALADVGAAIDGFRKSGKPVLAFANSYTNDGYQLAAHATEIWVDPMGGAMFAGPGGSNLYFKSALDKLGVTAHVYRVGTYKSAVEPLIRDDQSPASEEAARALYAETWTAWQAEIARARPRAKLAALVGDPAGVVEAARGDLAAIAVRDGIVDRTGDRMAFGRRVAGIAGAAPDGMDGRFATVRLANYVAANSWPTSGSAIGVVTIAGDIVDGKGDAGQAGGQTISKLIYDGLADDSLKALVVRVDSPGGSVMASEEIRRAILAAKAKRLPVVVSMGNLAASGGYWVSTPADFIFAEPATITGSIGIFGVIPSVEKALGRIGVTADGVKTTPLSGEPDVAGGFAPEFDRVVQAVIEKGYRDFLSRVATSRKKTPQQVDAIGQGRVWAGGTARQIGLVDRFGNLDDALAEAARRAKLSSWHPVWLEDEPDATGRFIASLFAPDDDDDAQDASLDLFGRAAASRRMMVDRALHTAMLVTTTSGAQARCVECAATVPARAPRLPGSASLWTLLLARLAG